MSFQGFAIAIVLAFARPDAVERETAAARLMNADGEVVGEAVLRQTAGGVLIDASFSRTLAGTHAFHIHEKGVCEPPFDSAGGHFAPGGTHHGYLAREGPHAGDLPNIHVPATTRLRLEVFAPGLTLTSGTSPILDDDGAALVVHEKADDYRTDPAGEAGKRIACGVIR
jgi:Cu-Zn family superoxide dismutase